MTLNLLQSFASLYSLLQSFLSFCSIMQPDTVFLQSCCYPFLMKPLCQASLARPVTYLHIIRKMVKVEAACLSLSSKPRLWRLTKKRRSRSKAKQSCVSQFGGSARLAPCLCSLVKKRAKPSGFFLSFKGLQNQSLKSNTMNIKSQW